MCTTSSSVGSMRRYQRSQTGLMTFLMHSIAFEVVLLSDQTRVVPEYGPLPVTGPKEAENLTNGVNGRICVVLERVQCSSSLFNKLHKHFNLRCEDSCNGQRQESEPGMGRSYDAQRSTLFINAVHGCSSRPNM